MALDNSYSFKINGWKRFFFFSFSFWVMNSLKVWNYWILSIISWTWKVVYLSFWFRNQESVGTWRPCFCCNLYPSFGSCNSSLLCCVSLFSLSSMAAYNKNDLLRSDTLTVVLAFRLMGHQLDLDLVLDSNLFYPKLACFWCL